MLVLPVLLLVMMGIIEFGRLFAFYAGVTSASREAARYGASVGGNGAGVPRYLDCEGIRDAARRVALFAMLTDLDIDIRYDRGDPSQPIGTCDSHPDPDEIKLGDRVVVTVTASYTPFVPLVPVPVHTITSSTARTILKDVEAGPTATLGGAPVTDTPTVTPLPTDTPDPGATPTATPTATATLTPTSTATTGPSPTPTATNTPVPTATSLPAPNGFQASLNNCSSRKVSFTWDTVPGADYYIIYRQDPPPVVQIVLDSNPPCNNCDQLPDDESSRTYYVVAVFGSHQSPPSNTSTVSCP